MELSIFIAQLYGVATMVLGLAILVNMEYYRKLFPEMVKDTTYIFICGLFAIIIGTVIIVTHSVWEMSWVVIITIMGWLCLIKGFFLLVFPKSLGFFASWFKNKGFLTATGFGSLILGLVICYFAFFV